jgi:transposase-like protein
MDTSAVAVRADTLGRRVVPRHFRSLADKLKMIAEVRVAGASVAAVARQHGVNANLLFAWMRQQEQGVLGARTRRSQPKLLAVRVAATVAEAPARAEPTAGASGRVEYVEIALPDGTCIRAASTVPMERLEQLVRLLRR